MEKQAQSNSTETSRRTFLLLLAGLVSTDHAHASVKAARKTDVDAATQIQQLESNKPVDRAYERTMIESALLKLGSDILSRLLKAQGINVGAANHEELVKLLKQNPYKQGFNTIIVASTLEESIFRLIPSMIADAQLGPGTHLLTVGIPMSALFAGLHNIHEDTPGHVALNTKRIPLFHFLAGVFYWYLMREHGVSHAILAHATHNTIGVVVANLNETYPDKSNNPR